MVVVLSCMQAPPYLRHEVFAKSILQAFSWCAAKKAKKGKDQPGLPARPAIDLEVQLLSGGSANRFRPLLCVQRTLAELQYLGCRQDSEVGWKCRQGVGGGGSEGGGGACMLPCCDYFGVPQASHFALAISGVNCSSLPLQGPAKGW